MKTSDWQKLERVYEMRDGTGKIHKITDEHGFEMWGNDLYSVIVRKVVPIVFAEGECLWLSIHRRDRAPIRDWRHMQRIKNDICGEESEGVELYPCESRVVDTANEYMMFVFPNYTFPFGFTQGLKLNEGQIPIPGAKQRPLDEL